MLLKGVTDALRLRILQVFRQGFLGLFEMNKSWIYGGVVECRHARIRIWYQQWCESSSLSIPTDTTLWTNALVGLEPVKSWYLYGSTKNISNLFVYLKYFCYICIVSSFIILGIQGGCFHTILSWNGWRGKKCNIGEVSSLHILVMGNVITVRLQEGDYGNPFILNYMPKWGNGRPSRLKICRLQRRASSTLALGTKKIK